MTPRTFSNTLEHNSKWEACSAQNIEPGCITILLQLYNNTATNYTGTSTNPTLPSAVLNPLFFNTLLQLIMATQTNKWRDTHHGIRLNDASFCILKHLRFADVVLLMAPDPHASRRCSITQSRRIHSMDSNYTQQTDTTQRREARKLGPNHHIS